MKRFFSVFLAVLTVLLASCQSKPGTGQGTTGGEESTEQPEAVLTLIRDGSCDYRIVVPVDDKEALEAGYSLRTALIRVANIKLTVVKDSSERTDYEILVGNTNRSASAAAQGKIAGTEDYCICVSGQSLVIAGGSADAIMVGVERLLADCYADGSLQLAANYSLAYTATYLKLTENNASEYVFVVSKSSSGDYDRAFYLQKQIRTKTGVRIPIVYDTAQAQSKEILVGLPNRTEAATIQTQLETNLDYYVGAIGEKVVICGKSESSLATAVDWFLDNCVSSSKTLTVNAALSYLSQPTGYEALAIRINNQTDKGYQTLETLERVTIYEPTDTENGWWYDHHAAVTCLNGVYIAVWSQGRRNEDDLGQRIAYATSTDFYNWTPARTLVDTWMGTYSEMVLGCAGLWNNGEQVVVYFGASEYDPSVLREDGTLRPTEDGRTINHGRWYVTTTDGIHWSEPQKLSVSGGGHQGPILMDNGELLWAGGTRHAYSDDLSGLTWNGSASVDDSYALTNGKADGVQMLCEGSFIVKDDVVYLFHRTNSDYLWVAFSTDWGRTWSLPYKTSFTDAHTKFMFGKLPDGRYWCVSDPDPKGVADRTPMILSVSSDGINWNEQYMLGNLPHTQNMPGMYKGGIYGYPNCFVGEDGYFHAIYSLHKEDIEILRFKLSEIGVGDKG